MRNLNEFRPPWWLSNGHASTIWAYLFKPSPRVEFRRERIKTADGDWIDLDWMKGDPGTPLVVGCHGLEGSADTPYMRRFMARARGRGWGGVALNYRGCSGEDNDGLSAYHSGFIEDLEFVVDHLADTQPDRPLYLTGYSLGGSILANYLGQKAASVPDTVRAAFLCSAPFLLKPGSDAIGVGFNRFYEMKFLLTLRKKAALKGKKHPEFAVQARKASSAWSIRTFDEEWIAPVFGFEDADDYYAKASSAQWLGGIKVPTRALHAKDDPFIVPDCVPEDCFRGAENVELCWTEQGGHVGFVCDGSPHWLEDQMLNWFEDNP